MPCIVVLLLIASAGPQSQDSQSQKDKDEKPPVPVFSDEDGVRVLSQMAEALENYRQDRFLKLFDEAKMPDYNEFRDQVLSFFQKYEAFQVRYHLRQSSMEGDEGILLADFAIEATPAGGSLPNVRKDAALRLVVANNRKDWKIVDLSPRELFSTN